ncbi:hypothetical protein FRC03_010186 [Tulasnella sp. 419]|nr:hypothetical protein FRC03_010186 [Tulasnella sp. 419]
MDVASLVMGAIPLVLCCAQAASSVRSILHNATGGFRKKRDQLVEAIGALLCQMAQIQDVIPADRSLEVNAEKLKDTLEKLVRDLQGLISTSKPKMILHNLSIEKRLDEALQQVADCRGAFNTSCAYYLLTASAYIRKDINQLTTNTENQAALYMATMADMKREILSQIAGRSTALESELRSRAPTTIKVRYFGTDVEQSYEADPKEMISHIMQQIADEGLDIDDIHFFSWSKNRHRLTTTGQKWRFRRPNVRISTIMNQCGKKDDQDVDWRLEYVRDPESFTIFLVGGVPAESGLLIHLPLDDTLEEKLQQKYSCYGKLMIEQCYQLENEEQLLNWKALLALKDIKPCTNLFCITLKECTCLCDR